MSYVSNYLYDIPSNINQLILFPMSIWLLVNNNEKCFKITAYGQYSPLSRTENFHIANNSSYTLKM